MKLTSLIRKYQSQSNSGLLAGLSYIFSIPQQFPEPPKGDPSSFLIECQQRFQIINMMLEGVQRLPEIVLVGVVFSALLRHPFYRNLVAQYNSSSISDLSFESLSAQINSHFETNNAGRSTHRDTTRQLRSTELAKKQAKEHQRELHRLEHRNKSLAGKLASAKKGRLLVVTATAIRTRQGRIILQSMRILLAIASSVQVGSNNTLQINVFITLSHLTFSSNSDPTRPRCDFRRNVHALSPHHRRSGKINRGAQLSNSDPILQPTSRDRFTPAFGANEPPAK